MSLAWGPLAARATAWFGVRQHADGCGCGPRRDMCWTPRDLADLLGMKPATVWRWQARGIPFEQADRVATALEIPPDVLWPAWADWMAARIAKLDAADEKNRQARLKRDRDRKRREYQDPVKRAKKQAQNRAYRAAYHDGLLEEDRRRAVARTAARRAYYRKNRDRLLAYQRDYDARRRAA